MFSVSMLLMLVRREQTILLGQSWCIPVHHCRIGVYVLQDAQVLHCVHWVQRSVPDSAFGQSVYLQTACMLYLRDVFCGFFHCGSHMTVDPFSG